MTFEQFGIFISSGIEGKVKRGLGDVGGALPEQAAERWKASCGGANYLSLHYDTTLLIFLFRVVIILPNSLA